LTELLNAVGRKLTAVPADASEFKAKNMVDYLFGGDMTVTQKCEEGDEPEKRETVLFTRMRCHIELETNYLYQGLAKGLTETIEKMSPVLNRNARYLRKSLVSRLPRYLLVQFVRFFWRVDNKKTKILRKVVFPDKLDTIDYCDPKLKASLLAARQELQTYQEEMLGLLSLSKKKEPPLLKDDKKKDGKDKDKSAPSSAAASDASKTATSTPAVVAEGDKMTDETPTPTPTSPPQVPVTSVEMDTKEAPEPTITSGQYELMAVVTHQGRSTDSGHYVGWCKKQGDTWLKFDDDVVSETNVEAVKALCGGGDWHMSYFTFYRRIDDFTEASKAERLAEMTVAKEKRAKEDAIIQKAKEEEAAKKKEMSKVK